MAIGHRLVGDADVGLGRIVSNVLDDGSVLAINQLGLGHLLPSAERFFDDRQDVIGFDTTGHAQDRPVGTHQLPVVIDDVRRGDIGELFQLSVGGGAPGRGEATAAELDHQSLSWLVLHGTQGHLESLADGIELVGREVRFPQDVPIDGQCLGQPIGNGGTGKAQVLDADRFAALQTEIVERGGQLAAVQ